ncbi:MAG: hemerythrin domain-containing protein [Planctomycetales bacterium]|nr:hemerythrin domain-containing protein [Planctomycetales bacterium]
MNIPETEATKRSELVEEFVRDHKEMSQLLMEVITHLKAKDVAAARSVAQELDRVAGPHIQYEEGDLYPRVSGRAIESEYTRSLYHEHLEAVTSLKLLLCKDELSEEEVVAVLRGLRNGLKHAEQCGSLVNLLSALPEVAQRESLVFLRECRDRGRLWTDLIR